MAIEVAKVELEPSCQAVRVRREPDAFTLHTGQRAELVSWGVIGMLRHALFVRWSA